MTRKKGLTFDDSIVHHIDVYLCTDELADYPTMIDPKSLPAFEVARLGRWRGRMRGIAEIEPERGGGGKRRGMDRIGVYRQKGKVAG